MIFSVLLDEMQVLGERETLALQITRRNAAYTARKLTIEKFGFLVDCWNELTWFERRDRQDYCRRAKHDWRVSPYSGKVCARCLKTMHTMPQ